MGASEVNTPTSIDIGSIMRILPHRYPLLLVDGVLECEPGKYILGVKNVSRSDPMLGATERTLPHLIVIEALAQLSVILAFKTLALRPTGNELMFFAGIDSARFGRAVHPGDQLRLHSEVTRIRQLIGWFKASAVVDGEEVIAVSMLAAIRQRTEP
jgi:3-hydroxyacyl-[acyl-carrier-protein] dehydratase